MEFTITKALMLMPMHHAKSAFNDIHHDVHTEREILNFRRLNQVGREKKLL